MVSSKSSLRYDIGPVAIFQMGLLVLYRVHLGVN